MQSSADDQTLEKTQCPGCFHGDMCFHGGIGYGSDWIWLDDLFLSLSIECIFLIHDCFMKCEVVERF